VGRNNGNGFFDALDVVIQRRFHPKLVVQNMVMSKPAIVAVLQ